MKFKREEMQSVIDEHLSKVKEPKILEAGCGSVSKINLPAGRYLVGIDISQKQLDRNYILDEKILGDIQEYDFNPKEFDMIVCWHVLEHLDNPERALKKFISAVKDDGIIIISSPNPLSVKGLITKFTPHWVHIFVYRFFYGYKDAGKNDTAPFPTILRFFISPKRLLKYARKNNMNDIFSFYSDAIDGWVGKSIKSKSRIIFYAIKSLNKIVSILTLGLISNSEFILVFQKTDLNSKMNIDQLSSYISSADSQDVEITV